jgi:hypothetical protein
MKRGLAANRAWFKKVSGTVAGTARRVLRTTVPDTFLNQAPIRTIGACPRFMRVSGKALAAGIAANPRPVASAIPLTYFSNDANNDKAEC